MWRDNFTNANPATIMQRLYQIKAEQDGRDVVIVAHAVERKNLPEAKTAEYPKRGKMKEAAFA